MENIILPLLIGVVGAIIGSLTSLITIFVQSHYEKKRALVNNSVELALEHYKIAFETAKSRGDQIYPLSLYLHYHVRVMEYAVKKKLSKEALLQIDKEQKELKEVMDKLNENQNKTKN